MTREDFLKAVRETGEGTFGRSRISAGPGLAQALDDNLSTALDPHDEVAYGAQIGEPLRRIVNSERLEGAFVWWLLTTRDLVEVRGCCTP
jgi:hypothetical protein